MSLRFLGWVGVVILLLAGVSMSGLGLAELTPLVNVPHFKLPTMLIFFLGTALGCLFMWCLRKGDAVDLRFGYTLAVAPLPGIVLLACLFLFAHSLGLPGERAAVGLVLAVIALVAGLRCIELLADGKEIGFESHWGGLGGGSSGWRLFPGTGLALMSIAFAGASLALVMGTPAPPDETSQETKDKGGDAGAEAGTAAGGEAGNSGDAPAGAAADASSEAALKGAGSPTATDENVAAAEAAAAKSASAEAEKAAAAGNASQ